MSCCFFTYQCGETSGVCYCVALVSVWGHRKSPLLVGREIAANTWRANLATSVTHSQNIAKLWPHFSTSTPAIKVCATTSLTWSAAMASCFTLTPWSLFSTHLQSKDFKTEARLCHILLKSFHWYPILLTAKAKIPIMGYRALHNVAPESLWSYLLFCPSCFLCSSHTDLFAFSWTCQWSFHSRVFSWHIPSAWNSFSYYMQGQIPHLLQVFAEIAPSQWDLHWPLNLKLQPPDPIPSCSSYFCRCYRLLMYYMTTLFIVVSKYLLNIFWIYWIPSDPSILLLGINSMTHFCAQSNINTDSHWM